MKLLGTLMIVAVVFANDDEDDFLLDVVQLLDECDSQSLTLCFKERALTFIDQLPNDIEVGGAFTVKQIDVDRSAIHLPTLPEESNAREEVIDNVLIEKIYNYLKSHTFEFKIPNESIQDFRRSFEDEARKKKRKGIPIMILFQLKAAAIGALLLKVIGLVAMKALVFAKLALTIASIIGLKKQFEHKKHSSTYAVVAHPHYSEEHGHYDRSFNQQLAYKGHEQAKLSNRSL